MTAPAMSADEVLAVLDREAYHAWLYRLGSYAGHSEREMAAKRGKDARTAVAALIARNAEMEAALTRALPTVEHMYHTNPDPDGSFWDDVIACREALSGKRI
jgi:hypothetical protein